MFRGCRVTKVASVRNMFIMIPHLVSYKLKCSKYYSTKFDIYQITFFLYAFIWLLNFSYLSINCLQLFRSFFQSVCVLGYCVLPLTLALVACKILLALAGSTSTTIFAIRCAIVVATLVWSCFGKLLRNYQLFKQINDTTL